MTKKSGRSRRCLVVRKWSKAVRERDGKCMICGTIDNLHAHHIIPWRDDESKRLDVDNGITYCSSCHMSLEAKRRIPWIVGKKHTEESKKKMSLAKIGHIPWNAGVHKILEKFKCCRICGVEKAQDKFTKTNRGYSENRCKDCRNSQLRAKNIKNLSYKHTVV
jgi:hypothetical protein